MANKTMAEIAEQVLLGNITLIGGFCCGCHWLHPMRIDPIRETIRLPNNCPNCDQIICDTCGPMFGPPHALVREPRAPYPEESKQILETLKEWQSRQTMV